MAEVTERSDERLEEESPSVHAPDPVLANGLRLVLRSRLTVMSLADFEDTGSVVWVEAASIVDGRRPPWPVVAGNVFQHRGQYADVDAVSFIVRNKLRQIDIFC